MASRRSRRNRNERRSVRDRLRAKRAARRKLRLESLEPRILLTTLFGGEVFEYITADPLNPGSDGASVRITVDGDAVVEVIGVDIDDNNEALLGDTPGTVISSDTRNQADILGGYLGGGLEAIGQTPIDEPTVELGDIGLNQAGNINFDALASSGPENNGLTYGFSTGTASSGNISREVIQLAQLDNATGGATVEAVFHQGTLQGDVMSTLVDVAGAGQPLNNVSAMAIDPLTGLAYVINGEGGQAVLYQVNRVSGTVLANLGSITNTSTGGALRANEVQAATFTDAGELLILTTDFGGIGSGDDSPGIADSWDGDPPVALNPAGGTDVGLVHLGIPANGDDVATFTNADVDVITTRDEENREIEAFLTYTGMSISSTGVLYASAIEADDTGDIQATQLHNLGVVAGTGGATIQINNRGAIQAGGDLAITDIAFTTTYNVNTGAEVDLLVGIDHSQTNEQGATQARMVAIALGNANNSSLLSEAGAIDAVDSLATYTEAGQDRALLFAISANGQNILRGSANPLAMNADGTTDVTSLSAADFHPVIGSGNDGRLFFIASDGENEVDRLYSVDVTLGNRSAIQSSIRFEGNFGEDATHDRQITAMVFDQISDTEARLIIYDAVGQTDFGNGNVQVTGTLSIINDLGATNGADFVDQDGDGAVTPTYAGTYFTGRITSLEVLDTFTDAGEHQADQFVVAVDDNGANSNLIRIRLEDQVDRPGTNRDDTNVYILGRLPDRGAGGVDIQDITWNPLLIDPFTGEQGVLLGTDASSDTLYYIDSRGRFPTSDSFLIYITQADENATITISVISGTDLNLDGAEGAMPFDATPQTFRVINAQSGNAYVVTGGGNSGGALLGALTEDQDQDQLNPPPAYSIEDEQIPILLGDLDTIGIQRLASIGTLPQLFDEVTDPTDGDVHEVMSGLRITDNLLEFVSQATGLPAKLVGGNLDNLQELTVTRDGEVVFAVDEPTAYERALAAAATSNQTASTSSSGSSVSQDAVGLYFDSSDINSEDYTLLSSWPFQVNPGDPFELTYSYSNLLDGTLAGGISIAELRAAVEEGFALWAQYVPITFTEVPDVGPLPDDADTPYAAGSTPLLRIGHHYIDGPAGPNVLAHAYPPDPSDPTVLGLAGDLHFDDGNLWDVDLFLETFVHELGHALGLGHSTVTSSRVGDPGPAGPPIMNPMNQGLYNGLGSAFLFQDDVAGIQALYGAGIGGVGVNAGSDGAVLATIDPSTGLATSKVFITDAASGEPLFGIQGLDMADVDYDGVSNFGTTIGTAGEDLYAILSVDNPVPQEDLGAVVGLSNVVALTVAPGGTAWAVNENGGEFELFRIDRSAVTGAVTGTTLIGTISDALGTAITDVQAIEAHPRTGDLYIVGLDSDGDQALFIVDKNPSELTAYLNPGVEAPTVGDADDEALASRLFKLTEAAATFPDSITGLAWSLDGMTLLAARDNGGTSNLITIDTTDGSITDEGAIVVDGDGDGLGDDAAVVDGMDFNSETGSLYAVDRGAGAGTGRIVRINTIDPGNSRQVTLPGTVGVDIDGYASDPRGFFFAIDTEANLVRSLQDTPTLGWIDPSTGAFTQIGALTDVEGVRAMAFSPGEGSIPGQQGLYIVGNDNVLYEVNYSINALDPSLITLVTPVVPTDISVAADESGVGVDNGDFANAVATGLTAGANDIVYFTGTIGDDEDGFTDYDVYSVDAAAGQVISAIVSTQGLGSGLDPNVAIYDAAGNLLATNDDADLGVNLDSAVAIYAPAAGTYYIVIQSFEAPAPFVPNDPFTEATVNGGFSTGDYEANISLGATGPLSVVGLVIDSATGETVTVSSMDFDRDGTLFAHDHLNGRLVDITLTSLDIDGDGTFETAPGTAGAVTATGTGTLRPTVGAIAFDFSTNTYLAVDNAFSAVNLANEDGAAESAALMRLLGTESDSAVGQSIGKFFFAGAITGRVEVAGSVDQFYAGWLVTGNTQGEIAEFVAAFGYTYENNFVVHGDLRNLIVSGAVGGDATGGGAPQFFAGTDIQVFGRFGNFRSLSDVMAEITVDNDPTAPNLTAQQYLQTEIEGRHMRFPGTTEGSLFESGFLDNFDDSLLNDTFDTAQRLGTVENNVVGQAPVVQLLGTMQTDVIPVEDRVDYYALSLMAGQTITVQLTTLGPLPLYIGVYDPDGRLVYTDYDLISGVVQNTAFQVTADRPGEWRFAIAYPGDVNFNGVEDAGETVLTTTFPEPYLLSIYDAGDIALGALDVVGSYFNITPDTSIAVAHGDLGALAIRGNYFDSASRSMQVSQGNLRSIEAGEIGVGTNLYGGGPTLFVPNGSAGLIRATGQHLDLGGAGARSLAAVQNFAALAGLQVGGDIQVIDSPNGNMDVFLVADGGLGILRGASMTTPFLAPYIAVNGDNIGRDGIIDLIDFAGDVETPQISTGIGGNVRYARVGGTLIESPNFGGGNAVTLHSEGASVNITDDSGAQLVIVPTLTGGEAVDENGDPLVMPSLEIIGFGVSGSGGIVITSVTSTGGVDIGENSLGLGGSAEIGVITVNGTGTAVSTDANGNAVELLATDNDLSVHLGAGGNGRIDVLEIVGGNFNEIINNTAGEIVNLNIASVSTLGSVGSIGLAESSVGGTLIANSVINNTFPYNQQTTGIVVSGNVYRIAAHLGVGNLMVGGSVYSIRANAGLVNDQNVHEGVNAPIVIGGNLGYLNIGEGILASGSGDVARAGVFVGSVIGTIDNEDNLGADIRGDVVAGDSINKIELWNGSIINAQVWATSVLNPSFDGTREFSGSLFLEFNSDTVEDPELEIGSIILRGNGGILGSVLAGADIGNITVSGGFGIVNSFVSLAVDGTMGNVTVDGLGIRSAVFDGGTSMGNITATGRGDVLNVLNYSGSVRQSESLAFDPYTGLSMNINLDLHEFLGTSATDSAIDGVTNAGVIDGLIAYASRDLGRLSAYQILGSSFQFANSIASVTTLDDIRDSVFTTGRITSFRPGGDVSGSILNFAGSVGSIRILGDFDNNSQLNISGPNGRLGSMIVMGDYDGGFTAAGYVGSVTINGNLSGDFIIDGTGVRGRALGSFRLGGDLSDGSFQVTGDVGSMSIAGSLGDPDNPAVEDQIVIDGSLGSLIVGVSRDVLLEGAALNMQVVVLGDLNSLTVYGKIGAAGSVVVTGDLRSATITADTETGNNADPAPSGSIGDLVNGADTVFSAVAASRVSASTMYVVNADTINGNFELRRIDLLPDGSVSTTAGVSFVDLGTINDAGLNGAGTDIQQIAAMEYDAANNRLLLVGTTGASLEMFSIDLNTLTIASMGVLLAPGGAPIAAGGTVSVRALAVDDRNNTLAADDTLYAILHDSGTVPHETDTLITISLTGSGQTATVGVVTNEGVDTDIVGMDFITQGRTTSLVALHDDRAIDGDAQLLSINTTTGAATALNEAGSVDENLFGYTIFDGKAYAVRMDPDGVQDQLWESNHSLVDGSITVGGSLSNFTATGGDVNAAISAGNDISSVRITGGDLSAGGSIASALGDIRSISITGGSLWGDVLVTHGDLGSLTVTGGSDFGGSLTVMTLGNFMIQGSVRQGAEFNIEGEASTFNVGGDWEAGTEVTAGYNQSFTVGGDFLGSMNFGYGTRATTVTVRGNYGGQAVIDNDVTVTITGNFGREDDDLTAIAGTSMYIGRDSTSFRSGFFEGDLMIDGAARSIMFDAAANAVITTGFDLSSLRSTGAIDNTLIQVGISAGEDRVFGTGDPGEASRMANALSIMGTEFNNSILGVGGSISSFVMRTGMTGSSVSTGYSVGSGGVWTALADPTPLGSTLERNLIRSGGATGDRWLYRGDILNGTFGEMTDSQVTAGIDAGADGDFTNAVTNTILTSLTGGASVIRSATGTSAGGTGLILTDAGVVSDRATAGGVMVDPGGTATYALADIAPTLAGGFTTVTGTTPLTIVDGANTTTIRLTGAGSVRVYDAAAGDGLIDAIVLVDTSNSTLMIETRDGANQLVNGAMTVNRLISTDDASLASFRSNVNLGNSADPVDLWIDGGARTFDFFNMPTADVDADWNGRIGSDVTSITMNRQGAGTLRIGGAVSSLTIGDTDPATSGFSLLQSLGLLPTSLTDLSASTSLLASDPNLAGTSFVFDQAVGLAPIDIPTMSLSGAAQVVMDLYGSGRLSLDGMDFDALGQLLALTQTVSQTPTVGLGGMSTDAVNLSALAVVATVDGDGNPVDRVLGVNTVGNIAQLVEYDTTTGALNVIGTLKDVSGNNFGGHVLQMAADDAGNVYVLVDDRDGTGNAFGTTVANSGAALAKISTLVADSNGNIQLVSPNPALPFSPPARLDADPTDPGFSNITDTFVGMAVDADGVVWAVQRIAGVDTLVTLDTQTNLDGAVDVTTVGAIVAGATPILLSGIGFDQDGNLIGYNNDGTGAELIQIDTVTPGASTLATAANALRTDVEGFAFGRTGEFYRSYAFDTDYDASHTGAGPFGRLYVSANALSPLGTPYVPMNIVGGDLGVGSESLNIVGVTVSTTASGSDEYWAINLNDNATPANSADDFYELYRIVRDADTGAVTYFGGQFDPITVANGAGVGANAAALLGLVGADGTTVTDRANDLAYHGQAIATPLAAGDLLATFGVAATGDDLTITDVDGTQFTVDLTGDVTIQDAIDSINAAAGVAGSNLVASIDPDGTRLLLTDSPADASPFKIVDNRLPGPNNVRDINAFAANGNTLYFVGTRGTATAQELYTVNKLTGAATSFGQLKLGGVNITDSIVALSFDSTGNLYGLVEQAGGQLLVRISLTNAAVTSLGTVMVDGNSSHIVSFAFDNDDNLIAHEADVTSGSQAASRVVKVNLANPGASSIVTAHGSLNPNLHGLAYDTMGDAFSVYADGIVQSQFWSTKDPTRSLTLGIVDPVTGVFSQMQSLASDFDGAPLTSGLRSMTVDATNTTITGDVWVLTADGNLYLYDSTTGGSLVGSFGKIVNPDGLALRITAIEVADTTDNGVVELLATDARFNQLVRLRFADTDADGILDILDVAGDGVFDAGVDVALTTVDNDLDTVLDGVTATSVLARVVSAAGAVNANTLLDLDFDPNANDLTGLTDTSIVAFSDTATDSLGGIFASSYSSVRITDPNDMGYGGRVVAEGNSFRTIMVEGDFTGAFITAGDMSSYMQRSGDFNGTLSAHGDIATVSIFTGNFLANGVVHTDSNLRTLSLRGRDAYFAGSIDANSASSLTFGGRGTDTANILLTQGASSVRFGGAFEGVAELGNTSSFMVGGDLGSAASVHFTGDARTVTITGGTIAGSQLLVDGEASSIRVSGTHRGVIATQGEVSTASFADMDNALFAVGMGNRSTMISGSVTDSVISFGVWVGEDGLYNTLDDVIYGGGSTNISIRGNYTDSVIAAGVLPSLNQATVDGSPNLPANTRAYTGYIDRPTDGPLTTVDNAEAGGIFRSIIDRLTISGSVINSNPQLGLFGEMAPYRQAVVAAADGIGLLSGRDINQVTTRVYNDAFGAPTVDQVLQVSQSQFNVIFSEEINTDSFILSNDANNDGDDTDPVDTFGTVLILDQFGNVIDDAELSYTTTTDAAGKTHGVLQVIRQAGFTDLGLTVILSGGTFQADSPAIYDRSGGRSVLRDFNQDGTPDALEGAFGGTAANVFGEDPFGTLLDGNEDGIEGGDRTFTVFFADAPNTFLEALTFEVFFDTSGDGFDSQQVGNNFIDGDDIDIFHFTGNAFDYLSVLYDGTAPAQMAVFVRDTQGTLLDESDDTFEAISRYETNSALFGDDPDAPLFMAFELPPIEAAPGSAEDLADGIADGLQYNDLEFFVVLAPAAGVLESSASSNYTLTMNMATSDELLDGNAGNNSAGLPGAEQILYVSSTLNANNNTLGFQSAKQLVYVNFAGGRSDQTSEGIVNLTSLDAADLDPTLAGFTNTLIFGGALNGSTITGIVDNLVTVFNTNPASHPLGQLTVQNIGANLSLFDAATSGLYFTTVDPTTLGFEGEYTELFVGNTGGANPGLLGIASTVDFGNLSQSDQAIIYAENFQGYSAATDTVTKLNEYSRVLANVIAHELGHTLGLNHHPTFFLDTFLYPDDPDNDFVNGSDHNNGLSLMAYNTTESELQQLLQLGTQELTTREFPIGQTDTMDLLLKWLGSAL